MPRRFRNPDNGQVITVNDDASDEQIRAQVMRESQEFARSRLQGATARRQQMEQQEEFLGPAGPEPSAASTPVAGQQTRRPWSPVGALFPEPGVEYQPFHEAVAEEAGGVAGALGGGAGAALGGPLGGMLGGVLGEGATQALAGKSDPLALAASAIPIPATAAGRGVATRLPGAAKGIRQAAGPLWDTAESIATHLGLEVAPEQLAKAAAKLQPEALAEFATGGMKRLIKQGTRVGEKMGQPFKQFRDESVLLGKRVGSLARQGGPEYGQAKTLYKAMQQDMDAVIRTAPKELKPLLEQANKLSKQAAQSEKMGRAGTGLVGRALLGGGGYAYGGPAGATAALAPDIIQAGLETTVGRNTIATLARGGATIDQIVNALVQAGVGQTEGPPWEQE